MVQNGLNTVPRMHDETITILIPAYKPSPSLPELVNQISALGPFRFVVVNDGSPDQFDTTFEALSAMNNVTVLAHSKNLGKGHALKTGINHALVAHPDSTGIVTMDADGQHLPKDVARVADALRTHPAALCLGVRDFKNGTPLRSKIGNTLTGWIFKTCSGSNLADTQTGLRGLPASYAGDILDLEAGGYDFEFEALMKACSSGMDLRQVEIETVYEKGNPTSHFNPFLDSLKIYFVFLRYLSSSLLVSVIDTIFFSIAYFFSQHLLASMVAGRICAGCTQFFLAKHFVFNSRERVLVEGIKYAVLVVVMTSISYTIISMLAEAGANPYFAKVSVETLLFVTSFTLQRLFVFRQS